MSYAGKDPRSRRAAVGSQGASTLGRRAGGARALEREITISRRGIAPSVRESTLADEELDWQHIGLFAAGAVLGVALGAGAALLFAPQSGAEARHRLARRGRHWRERTSDAWDDLRHELRYAARRGKRRWQRSRREREMERELAD